MSQSREEQDRRFFLLQEAALLIAKQRLPTLGFPGTTSLRGIAVNMVHTAVRLYATTPERQASVLALSGHPSTRVAEDFALRPVRDYLYAAFGQIVPIRDMKWRTVSEALEEIQLALMGPSNSLRRLPDWLLLATLAAHDPDPLKCMALSLELDVAASNERESSA